MELVVTSEKQIFKFSKNNNLVVKVPSSAILKIETRDCYDNQIRIPEDKLDDIDYKRINPATGPIYIEGSQPGDTLKVTIEDIKLNDRGVIVSGKGHGVLREVADTADFKLVEIKENGIAFDKNLSIPVNPMIGVIGVAPGGEDVLSITPGSHGGNMDNTMVAIGAVIYFPVYVEGALFALGDIHAAMGDGEIGGTGVETSGCVRVKLEVIKTLKLTNPVLENNEFITTIASSINLDAAVGQATKDMAQLICRMTSMTIPEAAMLMSATGHAQICQVVNPLRTARFIMPKRILKDYSFEL